MTPTNRKMPRRDDVAARRLREGARVNWSGKASHSQLHVHAGLYACQTPCGTTESQHHVALSAPVSLYTSQRTILPAKAHAMRGAVLSSQARLRSGGMELERRAARFDYVPFGRIHDGSAAFVDVASEAGASAGAAALSRGRSPPMAATDSARAAIAVISRYALALSASVISVLSDASARSSTSSALSMNDMTREVTTAPVPRSSFARGSRPGRLFSRRSSPLSHRTRCGPAYDLRARRRGCLGPDVLGS